jgi:CBS-domain-containing membrane protein
MKGQKMLIKDVMSVDVIAIGENETLIQFISKLRECNFHALPVVDDKNNIRGVVTPGDIMKVFLPHNPVLDKLLRSTHLCN